MRSSKSYGEKRIGLSDSSFEMECGLALLKQMSMISPSKGWAKSSSLQVESWYKLTINKKT